MESLCHAPKRWRGAAGDEQDLPYWEGSCPKRGYQRLREDDEQIGSGLRKGCTCNVTWNTPLKMRLGSGQRD